MNIPDDISLEDACRVVERYARRLGKDCQIIFLDTEVSVAPLSWAGDSTGETLFDAMFAALDHVDS